MRRARVVACFASSTQQMNSLRASGVMSCHAASAVGLLISVLALVATGRPMQQGAGDAGFGHQPRGADDLETAAGAEFDFPAGHGNGRAVGVEQIAPVVADGRARRVVNQLLGFADASLKFYVELDPSAVDEVFLEESLEQKRDYILEHGADVLVMGDDWQGKFDDLEDVCEVVYLPRTPAISTTALIEKISGTGE